MLNPLSFSCEKTNIRSCSLDKYGNNNYINIVTNSDNVVQSYPAFSTGDNENEMINYCKKFFNVTNLEEAKNKNVIKIYNFNQIFALVNLENNMIFSLQAEYTPHLYTDFIDTYIDNNKYKELKNETQTIKLITIFLNELQNNCEESKQVKEIGTILYFKNCLEQSLNKKQITKKQKI